MLLPGSIVKLTFISFCYCHLKKIYSTLNEWITKNFYVVVFSCKVHFQRLRMSSKTPFPASLMFIFVDQFIEGLFCSTLCIALICCSSCLTLFIKKKKNTSGSIQQMRFSTTDKSTYTYVVLQLHFKLLERFVYIIKVYTIYIKTLYFYEYDFPTGWTISHIFRLMFSKLISVW